MDIGEELKERRIELLAEIPALLGMTPNALMEHLCKFIYKGRGKKGKALELNSMTKAKTRGHMSYSYEEFSTALDKAMEDYLGQEFPKSKEKAAKQEATRHKWEEKREFIHLMIATMYSDPSDAVFIKYRAELDEAMDRLLHSWESRFMGLDPWTAAQVECNFSLLDDVTGEDTAFVSSMLKLTEAERVHLGEWLPGLDCPTAGAMLERLDPEGLSFWKGLWSKAGRGGKVPLTGECWIRFREKVRALPLERALALLMFLDYILPAHEGAAARFGPEGMDLFLMFKYFLTVDGRGAVLDWLEARTKEGPGQ